MKPIEFFSSVPGVADSFPIIAAKSYTANWMSAAREDYIKEIKHHPEKYSHVFQCPGIFDLFNYGFIVPMWHDVMIKPKGDGFSWMIPSSDLTEFEPGKVIIGSHVPELLKFIPKREYSLKSMIKINTPWHIVAPKGIKFLVLPVAYADDTEFESCIGLLDPSINSEINIQLHWNVLNKDKTLKAGTPLAHLIPVTTETFDIVVRDMSKLDTVWLAKRKYINSCFFKTKRNMISALYYKHFGKK